MFPIGFFCNEGFAPRFFPKVGSNVILSPVYPGLATLSPSSFDQATLFDSGVQQATLSGSGVQKSTLGKRTT